MVEEDRVRLARVRAPEENAVRLLDLLIGARPAACSEDRRQTDDARGVSGPVTAIDVVVAEDLPGEFRREEVDLVGRLRAAEDSGGLATMGRQGFTESLGGTVECFVPGSGPKNAVVAD